MKVAYPGKFKHSMSECSRHTHASFTMRSRNSPYHFNRDRSSEQHSCRDLTGEHLSTYT